MILAYMEPVAELDIWITDSLNQVGQFSNTFFLLSVCPRIERVYLRTNQGDVNVNSEML